MKKRTFSQLISLLALNASWGVDFKWLCTPVLNCHSCALAFFACPIGIFVHYAGYHTFPYLALGTVLLLGVLIGRLLCGWICPFGFLQDLLHKIPSPKFELPYWTSFGKYVVLGLLVLALPFAFGADTVYSFCRVCPSSALSVTIPSILKEGLPKNVLPMLVRLGVLGGVVVLAIMSSRSFCKVFCPIGAILAPLNYVSFWAIKVPVQNCLSCKKCDRACPVGGTPSGRIVEHVSANREQNCIVCHECQGVCPKVNKPAPKDAPVPPEPQPDVFTHS